MQEYNVKFADRTIGTAQVAQTGLYYRITCKCRIDEGVHKLYADSEKGTVLVGVFYPNNGWYEIERRISMQVLGKKIRSFYINPTNEEQGRFCEIFEDQPFPHLPQIGKSCLAQRNGQWGINFD